MSFANRHNKGSKFNVDTTDYEYFTLEGLYESNGADEVYVLQGIYINHKSQFGDAPVAICEGFFANLPSYMLDECLDLLKCDEDIDDIKAGLVGFKIEPYEKEVGKKPKTCYGIKWVDIDA